MSNVLPLNFPVFLARNIILRKKLNLKTFWIFSFILIAFLLVFYVFQINSIVQNTYLLQGHQEELQKFAEENQKLELQLFELNSLENIEILVQNLNYERVDKIKYIQILKGRVVEK
ncbi:hypothetical protein IH779_03415 [Patescibacteria group bacterium]|nr:hypothetical protein [Patescibacteria group bacterium]